MKLQPLIYLLIIVAAAIFVFAAAGGLSHGDAIAALAAAAAPAAAPLYITKRQLCERWGGRSHMFIARLLQNDSSFPRPVKIGPASALTTTWSWLLSDIESYERACAGRSVPAPADKIEPARRGKKRKRAAKPKRRSLRGRAAS